MGLVNSAIGAFSEGGRFEEFGKGIGKDILKGIGSFIGGPGLVLVTAGIGKLFIDFGKFTGKAIAGIFELNKIYKVKFINFEDHQMIGGLLS